MHQLQPLEALAAAHEHMGPPCISWFSPWPSQLTLWQERCLSLEPSNVRNQVLSCGPFPANETDRAAVGNSRAMRSRDLEELGGALKAHSADPLRGAPLGRQGVWPGCWSLTSLCLEAARVASRESHGELSCVLLEPHPVLGLGPALGGNGCNGDVQHLMCSRLCLQRVPRWVPLLLDAGGRTSVFCSRASLAAWRMWCALAPGREHAGERPGRGGEMRPCPMEAGPAAGDSGPSHRLPPSTPAGISTAGWNAG